MIVNFFREKVRKSDVVILFFFNFAKSNSVNLKYIL